MFQSTKHYGHDVGLSCAFRQWRADSHCRFIHGYALAFHFVFEAKELDHRNWVIDFGGLKALKDRLKDAFDHKLLVAEDDPELDTLSMLQGLGVAQVLALPSVGCEAFAHLGYEYAYQTLKEMNQIPRVRVVSCEVREHGANSAIYAPPKTEFGTFGVR